MPLDGESTRTSDVLRENKRTPSNLNFQVRVSPPRVPRRSLLLYLSFSLVSIISFFFPPSRFHSRTRLRYELSSRFLPLAFVSMSGGDKNVGGGATKRKKKKKKKDGRAGGSSCPKKLRARVVTRRRGLNNAGGTCAEEKLNAICRALLVCYDAWEVRK